jgi:DNA helicase HerA-like ATPase
MQPVEEKLASFYLGQEYDLAQGKALDQPVVYDARDLTTHGVIVGMTGSGKTGLGVILLEEAALDGVPSLVIDPKGDMTNLLLTFPDLSPEELEPWVNPDDARRKNLEIPAFAKATAEQWKKGLANTGQSPERIQRLRDAADFRIYTPGSSAGRPMSILDSFKAPALSWDEDAELLRDKIASVVSALLGLVGVEADPMRSREHILLTNIFENFWRAGKDLDLRQVIERIQTPPFTKLGAFQLDTYYPEKERMELAILLNGLIASPSFADWTQGDPLDVDALLRSDSGKPKVSVIYIAHLSEPERQFFVTLLLEQVVSWVRAQSGTTSLRALLYMDEVFGYLPPVANPPSKRPMLTLLKQARAFGLGLLLATQNPVDLDYKALTNAGTWFIGRMQADRDKQRLLDGLEGAQAGAGLSRSELDRTISAIQPRVFLLHNVHADKPVIFTTRWAMSYLRGPLTLTQVRKLAALQSPGVEEPEAAPAAPGTVGPPARKPQGTEAPDSKPPQPDPAYSRVPPQLPSEVKQVFLPVQVRFDAALAALAKAGGASVRSQVPPEGTLVYGPGLVGLAKAYYTHAASRLSHSENLAFCAPFQGDEVDWAGARVQLSASDLKKVPAGDAYFADLPGGLGTAKSLALLEKRFQDHVFYSATLKLLSNPSLKLFSAPGETEAGFKRRCREAAELARDDEFEKVKAGFDAKKKQLEDRLGREEREMEQDKASLSGRRQEMGLSVLEAGVSILSGRRASRKLSTIGSKARLKKEAKARVEESEQAIEDVQAQIKELDDEAKKVREELTTKWQQLMDKAEEVEVRAKRSDIQVSLFGVAWIPRWHVTVAGQTLALPAFQSKPDE